MTQVSYSLQLNNRKSNDLGTYSFEMLSPAGFHSGFFSSRETFLLFMQNHFVVLSRSLSFYRHLNEIISFWQKGNIVRKKNNVK